MLRKTSRRSGNTWKQGHHWKAKRVFELQLSTEYIRVRYLNSRLIRFLFVAICDLTSTAARPGNARSSTQSSTATRLSWNVARRYWELDIGGVILLPVWRVLPNFTMLYHSSPNWRCQPGLAGSSRWGLVLRKRVHPWIRRVWWKVARIQLTSLNILKWMYWMDQQILAVRFQ